MKKQLRRLNDRVRAKKGVRAVMRNLMRPMRMFSTEEEVLETL